MVPLIKKPNVMIITKPKIPEGLETFKFQIRVSKKYNGIPLKLKIEFMRRTKLKPIQKLEDLDFDALEHELFLVKVPELLPPTPNFVFPLTLTPLLTLTSTQPLQDLLTLILDPNRPLHLLSLSFDLQRTTLLTPATVWDSLHP